LKLCHVAVQSRQLHWIHSKSSIAWLEQTQIRGFEAGKGNESVENGE
jgi:hypothetical protein